MKKEMMPLARKNHYVPIWYQKRFLPPNRTSFFYLDCSPEKKHLADGRIITMNDCFLWGPNKCFWVKDLYTTSFFGVPHDEIERYLFGQIDAQGAEAIDALVHNDIGKLHHLFSKTFEYIDAQKLRTPKGLAWIKAKYHGLSHM